MPNILPTTTTAEDAQDKVAQYAHYQVELSKFCDEYLSKYLQPVFDESIIRNPATSEEENIERLTKIAQYSRGLYLADFQQFLKLLPSGQFVSDKLNSNLVNVDRLVCAADQLFFETCARIFPHLKLKENTFARLSLADRRCQKAAIDLTRKLEDFALGKI